MKKEYYKKFFTITNSSHILSLFYLSLAFFISFHQYYHERKIQQAIDQDALINRNEEVSLLTGENQEKKTELMPAPEIIFAPLKTTEKIKYTVEVKKGDTFASILKSIGAETEEVDIILNTIKQKWDPKNLKVGQKLTINYKKTLKNNKIKIIKLQTNLNNENNLVLFRDKNQYILKINPIPLVKETLFLEGKIQSSFYETVKKLGIPSKVAKEAMNTLGYTMNLQHGIKKNDTFQIYFDCYKDEEGRILKTGELKYIAIKSAKRENKIYRFEYNGASAYYDENGQSIVRSFLQTPLEVKKMRVTSGFGMRMHPLKQFMKNHKGVDFGAPTGTAIMAAGDGVIVKMGYFGDYGKYIRIKHSNGYETAYAHLNQYSKDIRVGSRVSQRQVIGYVGSTGSATGPHLHFELIHKGVHINPMSVKQIPRVQLSGRALKNFEEAKKMIGEKINSYHNKS